MAKAAAAVGSNSVGVGKVSDGFEDASKTCVPLRSPTKIVNKTLDGGNSVSNKYIY